MILYIGNKLVSKERNASGIDTLSSLLKQEGYSVRAVSSYKIKILRLLSMCFNVFWFSRKIKYVLIDTYSTNNFYYAYIVSKLCLLLRLRYITILRGGNLPKRLDTSTKLSKALFNKAYKNIAPSNYLNVEFENRGYNVEFIPNVLEIKNYKFTQRGISIPKLLYVRAFASIYNPEMAILVLNELLKEHPKSSLCMIGPAKDNSFESCQKLVQDLKLSNKVEFTGKLSKEEWHKKAEDFNIFINTTNIDNTPVSVMEAMALGLPVVSTNVGGMPYLIENEVTGLLIDKDNSQQMVNAINELLANEDLAFAIAKNARKKVETFGWENVRNLWIKILK